MEITDWPNISNENRSKLFELCQLYGIKMDNKFLSEACIELIEKLIEMVEQERKLSNYQD